MWVALFGLVIYHELACAQGQLLSEAVDRALAKRPAAVYLFFAVTVGHLLNWLPLRYDPYYRVWSFTHRLKGTQ